MPACKQCGHHLSDGAKFCPECGEKTGMVCAQCGFSLRPEEKFCSECGSKVSSTAIVGTAKTIAIADRNIAKTSFDVALEAFNNEDYTTALSLLHPLAEQGNVVGQVLLGKMYYEGHGVEEDIDEAFAWSLKAAEQGNAEAQATVGEMYYEGHGVEEDIDEAFAWSLKAAEQGNAGAQAMVGIMYYRGHGVEEDIDEAFAWSLKAAEQGNAEAQFNMGDMYYLGEGVKKDKGKAFAWFLKAAEQGNAEAQRMVGHLYFTGIGVEKDIDEAFAWSIKAAEQGNAEAQADLEEYSKAAKCDARNTKPGKPVKNRLNSGQTTVNDSCKENANDGQLIPAKEAQGNKMWENVLNLALSALSNISAEKINDPVFMRKILGKAYSLLPFYAKIVISEEVFFNFCFDRRSFLIAKLSSGNKVITQSESLSLLPSENEQPPISRESKIINIVDEYSGKMFAEEKLYFFPGLDLEKLKNAFDSYIQDAMEKSGIFSKEKGWIAGALKATGITKDALPEALGIPLVLYDVTAFGSCKDGFLLTSKFFITKELMQKPLIIKLGHIESIDLKKSFLSAGKIVINGNALIDCNQGEKKSLQSFMEMFEEILSVDAT